MCSSTTAERQSLASRDRTCCLRRCLPARPLRYYGFRGSIAHPTQSLCTLRTRRRRRPRNTRYRAPATAYPDRSLTGRTTPAFLAHKQSILSLRGEMDCFAPLAMTAPGAHSRNPLVRNDGIKTGALSLPYSQLSYLAERKQRHPPELLVKDRCAGDRRLGALARRSFFGSPPRRLR